MPQVPAPNRPLAKVNVLPNTDGPMTVEVCFMPQPEQLVGEAQSKAVLALDASRSIKSAYGDSGPFGGGSPNYMQAVGRKIGQILCEVTKDGQVEMMYWAMKMGDAFEVIGSFDLDQCEQAPITGPKRRADWGRGTKLLPVIQHIVEEVHAASEWTMGVIITDGIIEDEQECGQYCMKVGQELLRNSKSPGKNALSKGGGKGPDSLKFVLIGVGDEVDEGQLQRFDDMFEGTPLEGLVDLWSSGMAADMRNEDDILGVVFGELVSEETIVADTAKVLDEQGRVVANFTDGLPGKFRFQMKPGSQAFTIQTPKGQVEQDISEALA
jgi:hypothetical protein